MVYALPLCSCGGFFVFTPCLIPFGPHNGPLGPKLKSKPGAVEISQQWERIIL